MAILDRLFPRQTSERLQARKTTGIKAYSETPGVLWCRPQSSSGVHVDEFEALTISAVFAACFRLANVAAMLPVGIYEKEAGGKRTEQTSNTAGRILAIEANPMQTAFTARHFMQFWKPLFGSACAEIGWDGAGRPRYLWPIEPWRVKPEYDDRELLYFKVDGRRKVQPGDMIYVPHVTSDGVCGQGFVDYALESIGQAIAADRSAGRFFVNDMRPGGILSHEGNPDKKARDELKEAWGRQHGGVENRGKVGVLWGGWKWLREAGMIDPDKAQLLETRQFSVLEVARWLNVPPHWLAELGRATWNNIESQSIETLIYTVAPMLVSTEQEYDRKLLAPPRLYCKHNVNAMLRGDMKTRSEFYAKMKEIGVYTTNQILAYEDENGIGAEGDQRFVPVNWQPADDLMTGGEAQRAAQESKQKQQQPPSNAPASGANEKQPPASSLASPSTGQPSSEMLEALRAVAEHALSGFAKKELNEARRAAKKPNEMMAWMDGFYPDFTGAMAAGLEATNKLRRVLGGAEGTLWPASTAADWVSRSRTDLLAAMECKSEEWPNRSAALLTAWESRASEYAGMIAEEVTG